MAHRGARDERRDYADLCFFTRTRNRTMEYGTFPLRSPTFARVSRTSEVASTRAVRDTCGNVIKSVGHVFFVRGEVISGLSRRTRRDKVATSTVSAPAFLTMEYGTFPLRSPTFARVSRTSEVASARAVRGTCGRAGYRKGGDLLRFCVVSGRRAGTWLVAMMFV